MAALPKSGRFYPVIPLPQMAEMFYFETFELSLVEGQKTTCGPFLEAITGVSRIELLENRKEENLWNRIR
jgi:hypothetical protein